MKKEYMVAYNVVSPTEKAKEQGAKPSWNSIGVAFQNKDGSWSVVLDALPVDGKFQLRLPEKKEQQENQ